MSTGGLNQPEWSPCTIHDVNASRAAVDIGGRGPDTVDEKLIQCVLINRIVQTKFGGAIALSNAHKPVFYGNGIGLYFHLICEALIINKMGHTSMRTHRFCTRSS